MFRSGKKILLFGLLLSALLLGACVRQQTPSDQVTADLDQLRKGEITQDMKGVFDSSALAEQYSEQYQKMLTRMQEFEYEILGEEVQEDGEHAVVNVRITTYDFGAAYEATREDVIRAAEEGEIDIDTDLTAYVYDRLFEQLLGLTGKDFTKEVAIRCTKNSDGDWIAAINSNEDLLDAVLGGLPAAASKQSQEAGDEDGDPEEETGDDAEESA